VAGGGAMYTASFEKVAVTAAQDLFQILVPADAVVILHACYVSQDTEEADAQAEMLHILIHRGSTNGSGGSTPTPTPMNLGGVAAGTVVEVNNTTQGTEGTFIHSEAWNVQAGFVYLPTPEMRPIISPSDLFHIELQDAPADSITMSGSIYFEELGG